MPQINMFNSLKNPIPFIALIATFVLAVSIYNFLHSTFIYIPNVEIESKETISFIETDVCEIRDFPENFANLRIKTKATIWRTWDKIYLAPNGCTYQTDNFFDSLDVLDLKNYNGSGKESINILKSDEPFSNEVDVEIIGFPKIFHNEDGKNNIKLISEDIKIISTFREFEPRAAS